MPRVTSFQNIKLNIQDSVARFQFNRPQKKNAMSPELLEEANQALEWIDKQRNIKVVIVTGSGDSFCAGMDLEKSFFQPFGNPDEYVRIEKLEGGFYLKLKNLTAVTVAVVNGWCLGGGVCVAGVCDIVLTAEDAVFGLSEINFGLFPGGGAMWATTHNLNRKNALYYSLTGERFDGRKAVELGLANIAVPREELRNKEESLVKALVSKNKLSLMTTKEVFEKSAKMDLVDSIAWEVAKEHELSYRSRAEWIKKGIGQFKKKKYRPGLESYELKGSQKRKLQK